jgi:DNA-binding NarL/FixJ family response regulator
MVNRSSNPGRTLRAGRGSSQAMIRVLIADDHVPTREDLQEILESDGRFVVCATASDAARAVQASVRMRPDVCLLDINMPGGGLAAAWEIGARVPSTKIVILTVSEAEEHLFAALRAGACGYLLKNMNRDRIAYALVDVFNGEAAFPKKLVARMADTFRDRGPRWRSVAARPGEESLTTREWQVLELMLEGLSTSQIADRLVMKPGSVRTHVSRILHKLHVPDRERAMQLFQEHLR